MASPFGPNFANSVSALLRARTARDNERHLYFNRTPRGLYGDIRGREKDPMGLYVHENSGFGKRWRGHWEAPASSAKVQEWDMLNAVSWSALPGRGDSSWARRGRYAVPSKRVRIGLTDIHGNKTYDIFTTLLLAPSALLEEGVDGLRTISSSLYKALFGVASGALSLDLLPDQMRKMFRYDRHRIPGAAQNFSLPFLPSKQKKREPRQRRIRDRTSRFNLIDVQMIDALEKATRKLDRDPGRNVKAKIAFDAQGIEEID